MVVRSRHDFLFWVGNVNRVFGIFACFYVHLALCLEIQINMYFLRVVHRCKNPFNSCEPIKVLNSTGELPLEVQLQFLFQSVEF